MWARQMMNERVPFTCSTCACSGSPADPTSVWQERDRADLEAGCLKTRDKFPDHGPDRQHDRRVLGAGASQQAQPR